MTALSINNLMNYKNPNLIKAARLDAETSMERLSSGKKINKASDSPADLQILSRLQKGITGYQRAEVNTNNHLSMLNTADSALKEIVDLLNRARELTVYASQESTTATERGSYAEEANALVKEVDRIAAASFAGKKLLDGTFTGKTMNVGPSQSDFFSASINSVRSTNLGGYISTGPTRAATSPANVASANDTSNAEDIVLTVGSSTTTIDVEANDSAEIVAKKVNTLTDSTGITARAATYAFLFSTNSSSANYAIKINDHSTASFAISSGDPSDAVAKINSISSTTGVTAEATSANYVLLLDPEGGDITIENTSSGTDLDVQAVKSDGITTQGSPQSLADGTASNNDATRVIGTLTLTSSSSFTVSQSGTPSQGYTTSGTPTLTALDSISLSTASNALSAIDIIDHSIHLVTSERGTVSAYINRLEHSNSFNRNMIESHRISKGVLEDADYALETSNLAKALIRERASVALLAQANASVGLVMELLGD